MKHLNAKITRTQATHAVKYCPATQYKYGSKHGHANGSGGALPLSQLLAREKPLQK
jgi:hypothetical protein